MHHGPEVVDGALQAALGGDVDLAVLRAPPVLGDALRDGEKSTFSIPKLLDSLNPPPVSPPASPELSANALPASPGTFVLLENIPVPQSLPKRWMGLE